jgi:hypothetical protein
MEFVFLSASKVLGINHKSGEPDKLLFEAADPRTKVLITRNLDQNWYILDRQAALATMMLMGMIGQSSTSEFSERLEQKVQEIREHRNKTLGHDGILLIEIRGEIDATIKEPKNEVDDLVLCFDAYDKKELKAILQNQVAAIFAAVRISGNGKYELEKVSEGSYLVQPDGRVVHSFSIEFGGATVYTSAPIDEEDIFKIRKHIDLILKEKELVRVVRLFAYSMDRGTDELRTFITAWSALEILISKIFPKYENYLFVEISKLSKAYGLKQYLDRISDVMKGKYSLVDKFAVISIFLDEENETEDIATFKKAKKVRDEIFHGEDILEGSLPSREIQRLFEKYFCKHILRVNPL